MSHSYRLRIEADGVLPSEDDLVLDEVVPRWWNGDYGRTGATLWIEGVDRLCGGRGPEDLRDGLALRLSEMLSRPISVKVSGTDLEGVDAGRRVRLKRKTAQGERLSP